MADIPQTSPPSTGALCNDPNGLCLGQIGEIDTNQHAQGSYTSLMRLASQLSEDEDHHHHHRRHDDDDHHHNNHHNNNNDKRTPLITIETDAGVRIVKEYDGHTIVLRVPSVLTKVVEDHPQKSEEQQEEEQKASSASQTPVVGSSSSVVVNSNDSDVV